MSNSPRNLSELDKTASVDDRYINAPGVHQSWKLLRVPKTLSNSAQNGLESAEYVSVDDQHVNAPRGSSIVEMTPRPENRVIVQETGKNRPKL